MLRNCIFALLSLFPNGMSELVQNGLVATPISYNTGLRNNLHTSRAKWVNLLCERCNIAKRQIRTRLLIFLFCTFCYASRLLFSKIVCILIFMFIYFCSVLSVRLFFSFFTKEKRFVATCVCVLLAVVCLRSYIQNV